MSSVEVVNAVMRERARIREAVVKLPIAIIDQHPKVVQKNKDELIKRSEVLAILDPKHPSV